jgi:phosphatidylglycerophosphatase A
MSKTFVRLISTFFYVGYFPMAPGTLASIVGAAMYFVLREHPGVCLAVFCVVAALGFWLSGGMEEIEGQKDPSCVVIDEVAGVMIAFFMLPMTWPVMLTAFFLFRAFDMFKIYPVNKFEPMHGGTGIMLDDLFAGLYTNLVMRAALWLIKIV